MTESRNVHVITRGTFPKTTVTQDKYNRSLCLFSKSTRWNVLSVNTQKGLRKRQHISIRTNISVVGCVAYTLHAVALTASISSSTLIALFSFILFRYLTLLKLLQSNENLCFFFYCLSYSYPLLRPSFVPYSHYTSIPYKVS